VGSATKYLQVDPDRQVERAVENFRKVVEIGSLGAA
jgi:hypothetical protein